MNEQQRHQMELDLTHPSGAEEWNCPTCGRRLLINWEPGFKKMILEAGDEFSIHSGGKGGLSVGGIQVAPAQDSDSGRNPQTPDKDERLAPWEAWMEERDFDDLWGDEAQ